MPLLNGQPPGPRAYPFFGNTFLARRDPLGTLAQWHRQYGDVIHYRFCGLPVYILAHPRDIEQVLLADAHSFTKGLTSSANPELFGNGLLTSDGEFWRRQRRLANPAFHRENIARYAEIALEEAARLVATWQDGQTRDIHQDMMNVTLRVVLRSLFGTELADRGRIIKYGLDAITRISAGLPAVLFYLKVPTPMRRRYFRAVRQLDEVVYELIALGRGRLKQDAASRPAKADLLTMLLTARDDDGKAMTDQQLRDEVITLLLAGHETTALNLSWTWYLLATNPDVEQKLFDELDRVFHGRLPEPSDQTKLPYTDKVLRESLRLYPPGWRIWRRTMEPFRAGDFLLPLGANIVVSQWLTHRDPRWFAEPERFNPDRWTEEATAKLPRFAYYPFGGGPRVCIGAGFAGMEATLLLAWIARQFRLQLVPNQCFEPLASITLRPKHGIKVRVKQRAVIGNVVRRAAANPY